MKVAVFISFLKKNHRCSESGYSMIELLTVIGIIVVIGGILFTAWSGYYPTFALEQAASKIASDLNYASFQAVNSQNWWLVIFIYLPHGSFNYAILNEGTDVFKFQPNSYVMANDDGWKGQPPRTYKVGSLKFDFNLRGDGKMSTNEYLSGPIFLGKGIRFLRTNEFVYLPEPYANELYNPERIRFKWDWTSESISPAGEMQGRSSLWIVDQYYKNDSQPNYDNEKHRRRIKIRPNARVDIAIK